MIKNQLKLVWRTLLKNRMTSLINLVGLTIGLTATILIGLYLANEWQTDRSLPDPDPVAALWMVHASIFLPEDKAHAVHGVDPETVVVFEVEQRGAEFWAKWGSKAAASLGSG